MKASIAVVPDARFCAVSEDLSVCFGLREDAEGSPLQGLIWQSGSIRSVLEVPLSLTCSRAK